MSQVATKKRAAMIKMMLGMIEQFEINVKLQEWIQKAAEEYRDTNQCCSAA